MIKVLISPFPPFLVLIRIEQVKESYWKDFKELNDKGVKLFQASSRLLKAEVGRG